MVLSITATSVPETINEYVKEEKNILYIRSIFERLVEEYMGDFFT